MSNPDVTINIVDGASNLSAALLDDTHIKVGVCSLGTDDTIYSFSDAQDVRNTLGEGPLVEAAVDAINVAGGPVYLLKLTASVVGVNSAVGQTGAGPLPSLAGAPFDDHTALIRITKGGIVTVAEFQWSLDGGDTWSPITTTAASFPIPASGTTVTFTAGTYVLDEIYDWTGTAPYYSTSDLNAGFTALWADPREWIFAHILGQGAAGTDSATMIAAVQSQLATGVATHYRYTRAIVEMADDTDANLITAFVAVTATRCMAAAGFCEFLSGTTGFWHKRAAGWPIASRAAKVAKANRVGIATHLGRVRADDRGGALQNIKPGTSVSDPGIYRDEDKTPGLDSQRFATLRTIVGKAGYFVTRPQMMAPLGSDFSSWHEGLVIDKACRIMRAKLLDYLNDDVAVNADGTIDELAARNIEGDLKGALRDAMVSTENVVAATPQINRTNVMTNTKKLIGDVRLRKRGYFEDIEFTIGFEIPVS